MIHPKIWTTLHNKFLPKAIIGSYMVLLLFGCKSKLSYTETPIAEQGLNGIDTVPKLHTITFLPYWVAGAQFAGYYVAEEMGIYKKYGIKLSVIPYQPFITSTDLIKEGKADFAALWLSNAIQLKVLGTDIVNIAQLSSRSSLMLVAKKKSGIKSLQDMNGKKAGIWSGFELQPNALFKKFDLKVKMIPIGSTNNLFLMDGVDITNANWFDEYNTIINSGYNPDELNTFFFADYGMNFLEDGIYCLSSKLKSDPHLCRDFVNATVEGWMYAFNNQEQALNIVMDYTAKANIPANRTHQRWMLDRYKDLYIPNGKSEINTSLSVNDYQLMTNTLSENGLIKQIPDFQTFYQPLIK